MNLAYTLHKVLLEEMDLKRHRSNNLNNIVFISNIDNVLTNNTGTKAIQGIVLKLPKPKEDFLIGVATLNDFGKEQSLVRC
nr:hypothetical protein CFP56_10808 [Quercus suber]